MSELSGEMAFSICTKWKI